MHELHIFTTGGTIDKVYFDQLSDYQVGTSIVDKLLHEARVTLPFRVSSLLQKDSLDLDDDDRQRIRDAVLAAPERLIIITHGTDTMPDTARYLTDIPDKTIVMTGSLAPARFAMTDATFNVGMAVAAVQALDSGCYIVMNGQVFAGDAVIKNRDLNQFEAITG